MTNVCPVCGYQMSWPPSDFNICPCCATEFGYDDAGRTYEDLRNEWIKGGMAWWSPCNVQPSGWDPERQLKSLRTKAEVAVPGFARNTVFVADGESRRSRPTIAIEWLSEYERLALHQ
jgi:hypothetical protein